MEKPLPKRLMKEPLLDAVFEVRFTSSAPASNILPGIFYSKIPGKSRIESLPASQLPEALRAADPNLQYAPLIRIHGERNFYLISDRSMAISCTMPYRGWTAFKSTILESMNHLNEIGIITSVQRYSLKYVDLIPSDELENQAALVNLDLTVGMHTLKQESFQVRLELPKDGIMAIIQIASNAEMKINNKIAKKGLLVDIDAIKDIKNEKLSVVLETLSSNLDAIHNTNCQTFFDCLKPETIDALEPVYE